MNGNGFNQHPALVFAAIGFVLGVLVVVVVWLVVAQRASDKRADQFQAGYDHRLAEERVLREAALARAREHEQQRQQAQKSVKPLHPTGRYKPDATRVMPRVVDTAETEVMDAVPAYDPWNAS